MFRLMSLFQSAQAGCNFLLVVVQVGETHPMDPRQKDDWSV
jgi:hypothetical protein